MRVEIIETSSLGDRSCVVSDGGTAVVIDPQRDVDRHERRVVLIVDEFTAAEKLGLTG